MNKEQRLNKLTWKYFWQQKLGEVSRYLAVVLGVVFVPYSVGVILNLYFFELEGFINLWVGGFIIVVGLYGFVLIISFVLKEFKDWIKLNWEKAEERAKDKLKNENKRSRKTLEKGTRVR